MRIQCEIIMLKASTLPSNMHHQRNQYASQPENGHRPSKLQMMHMQMQQRHLREKEEKMIEYRNLNQNNSYLHGDGYNATDALGDAQESGTVRRLFQERRELSQREGYVPNIDHHYKKIKQGTYQYQTQGQTQTVNTQHGQVRTYGGIHKQKDSTYSRPPIGLKNSAGRDKSHPLAPIERTPKQTPHGSRQSSRRSSAQSSNSKGATYGAKPRFPRSRIPGVAQPLPLPHNADDQADVGYSSHRSVDQQKKATNFREWQERQKRIREQSAGLEHDGDHDEPSETVQHKTKHLTDFEKWQLEQDASKQARLQNHRQKARGLATADDTTGTFSHRSNNSQKNASAPNSHMNRTFSPETMRAEKMKQKKKLLNSRINSRKNVFPSPGRESTEPEDYGKSQVV